MSIRLGAIEVHLLSDGRFAMDGGAMFGIVPKPLWARHAEVDERNRITMSLHCPLAVRGSDVVLIDTGLGDRLSEKELEFYGVDRRGGLDARVREAGIDPEDITQVVLTHLHFDHFGGAVTRNRAGRLRPTFPRARHFIQRSELDSARNPANERLAAAYGHVPECLEPLEAAGLVELLEGETEIEPWVRVVVTGGHTPTHQCPVLSDGGESMVHLGDIAPTRAHLRPAWNQSYDVDPIGTMEAKTRLLERAAAEAWWVSFDHDHQVACARLGDGWRKGELRESVPLPGSKRD